MIDRSPVCPVHRKSMIRLEPAPDTHHQCGEPECPIRWNPTVSLFYLRERADWRLRSDND